MNKPNISFIIHPRQTGKTSKAIYEFLKNKNNIFIPLNSASNANILSSYDIPNDMVNNIISNQNIISEKLRGSGFINNIIIDEYLYSENRKILYELIKNRSIRDVNEIFIFTTSKKQYKTHIFDFVCKYKNDMLNYNMYWVYEKYYGKPDEHIKNEIDELYYNFITEPNCNIIDYGYRHKINLLMNRDLIPKERFEIEHLNNYLKEFKLEE